MVTNDWQIVYTKITLVNISTNLLSQWLKTIKIQHWSILKPFVELINDQKNPHTSILIGQKMHWQHLKIIMCRIMSEFLNFAFLFKEKPEIENSLCHSCFIVKHFISIYISKFISIYISKELATSTQTLMFNLYTKILFVYLIWQTMILFI